jgi:hypothetical protein
MSTPEAYTDGALNKIGYDGSVAESHSDSSFVSCIPATSLRWSGHRRRGPFFSAGRLLPSDAVVMLRGAHRASFIDSAWSLPGHDNRYRDPGNTRRKRPFRRTPRRSEKIGGTLIRNQPSPSPLTASDACRRGKA